MCSLSQLSPDGYERAFATNHLGHFQFVTRLLGQSLLRGVRVVFTDEESDLVETTAKTSGEARIVMTSSFAYRMAERIDYNALVKQNLDDGKQMRDLKGAMVRYGTSKLANIYFAAELSKRLRERGIENIYCNSCHPGMYLYPRIPPPGDN